MSNKKLIMIFLVVLVIIIVTIHVFISVKFNTKEKTISKAQSAEIKKRLKNIDRIDQNKVTSKYSSSVYSDRFLNLTYVERDTADERIDYILDLINTRNFQEFYNKLDANYKRARFENYDNFIEYFNETFPEDKTYSSSGYEINNISFLINIIDESTKNRVSVIRTSPVLLEATESFSMSFGDYMGRDIIKYIYDDNKIRITGNHILNYSDGIAIVPLMYNKTDNPITIDFDDSKFVVQNGQNEEICDLKTNAVVTIPPKTNKICEIKFDSSKRMPKSIIFNLKIDGETITSRITISQIETYEY